MARQHIYVIDTCVLLHDPAAIFKFHDNDIYLPLAVIDDLDELKTRPGSVGWSAREVFRILDGFELKELMSRGVKVNEQNGRLFIYNAEAPLQRGERPSIVRVNSDNAIIEATMALKAQFPKRKVSIVTKDTGLRVRATSWNCLAENYRSDMLEDEVFTGIRHVEVTANEDWKLLWSDEGTTLEALSGALQKEIGHTHPNEFFIFKMGESQCPTMYRGDKFVCLKDKSNKGGKMSCSQIEPKNIEQRCAMEALADPNIKMVSLCGPAGTGKTLITLAVALDQVNKGMFERIIVIKPLIPVGGKDIGALPGDKFEKIANWLGPIRDNIEQILGSKSMKADNMFEEMVQEGILEVEAMQFIQGRSIPNSIVVIDEAQNLTPRECRMAVERVGKDSKIILLGDLSQVENAFLDARSCGLAHAIMGGKNQAICAAATLQKVERSTLASIASDIFANPEARR